MHTSTITVNVSLDQDKVPDQIEWKATDSTAAEFQKARAMMISFWDGADKSALRVDLWTKEMMVDEMADFFYQTMSAMADTYLRATQQQELSDDLKNFAKEFYHKFRKSQEQQNS
ncbi:gliding motility-associated protein GldC [Filimonas zeae]|uniref:Gliding motility protein GldC n=1 Tax=Filimonas zeae TaxID=1737353 RepID=A0A917N0Q6_9BACT|nr:gliding motility protein GldC [Filimonas zeae]MDR6342449.1 gliding motility-associated protein GldC [Filimonas zeae]GGH81359.1 gliding motility protein GldC [Filimonas zeae]